MEPPGELGRSIGAGREGLSAPVWGAALHIYSTNSMRAIGAPSPFRGPSFRIRV